MVAFNTVKAGDVLWDVHRHKMGNTSMTEMGSWSVKVLEVDADGQRIFASWNTNRPRWWSRSYVEKLRRSRYKPRQPKPLPSPSVTAEGN